MRNPLKSTITDYLLACIHMIAASKHPVLLKYIPARKGYLGNEIADSLAKEGAENSHTLEDNESITDQKNQNKLQIKNQLSKKLNKNGLPLPQTTRPLMQSFLHLIYETSIMKLQSSARKFTTLLWNQYQSELISSK